MKKFLEKVTLRVMLILEGRVFGGGISWQAIIFILVLFGGLFLFQKEIDLQPDSDDMIFYDRVHQVSYGEWMTDRYRGWSGRIGYETSMYIFLHLPIWVEKSVNAGMILLFAYGVNRLFVRRVKMIDFLFVLCLFGFIGQRILTGSTFALHAMPNYFWPVTLGILALVPLADRFFGRREGGVGIRILYGLGLVFSVFANEQMAILLLGFYGLAVLFFGIQKKYVPIWMYVYLGIMAVAILNIFFAPGNDVRYASEIVRWYPEFSQLSVWDCLVRGGVWFFKKFFEGQQYLVLLLGAVASMAYWMRLQKRNYLLECLVAFPVATLFMKGIRDFDKLLFDFNDSKNFALGDVWMYVYWSVYLFVLLYVLFRIDAKKFLYPIIFLAGISTMLLMFASPTIYASANRVLLVNSAFLIVLINGIRIQNRIPIQKYLFIFAIFAVVHLLTLFFLWEQKGFHIYY